MGKLVSAIILVFAFASVSAQDSGLLLRWKLKDTVAYHAAFGEVIISDSMKNTIDSSNKTMMEDLKQRIGYNVSDYEYSTSIAPFRQYFIVDFAVNNRSFLKGTINEYGKLLTPVEPRVANFFRIFCELPERAVRVGDTWRSNIQFEKNMPGLVFTDSVRQDKVTVKAFEKKDNNDIVVLAYSLSESYVGKIIDGTGLEQPGLVQIFYDATSRFNVTLGKWESIDGIVVYDINVLQRKRSILKVGMIPRQ